MEEILTSLENHQGAAVCVAIFIIIVLNTIPEIINELRRKR
jgi:hypothetical protein